MKLFAKNLVVAATVGVLALSATSSNAALVLDYPVTYSAAEADEFYGCTQQSWGVSNFDVGDYIKFSNVNVDDFGEFKLTAVTGTGYNSTVEVRIDSPAGPIIAVAKVATSDTWWPLQETIGQSFKDTEGGVHDLYVVCSGAAAGNIQQLYFRVWVTHQIEVTSVVDMDTTYYNDSQYYIAEGIWETVKTDRIPAEQVQLNTAEFDMLNTAAARVNPSSPFWAWITTGNAIVYDKTSPTATLHTYGSGTAKAVYAGDHHAKMTVVQTAGGTIVNDSIFAFEDEYYPISAVADDGYAFSHWEITETENHDASLFILDPNAANTAMKMTCNYWTCGATAQLRAIFYQQ